ncbi:MAG: hypothetical protein FWG61_06410 [Firmicutes bacterium]|nr:hypothetical protein [Bacillota bacterium]
MDNNGMNSDIANSLAGYIESLKSMNRNLIKACAFDDDRDDYGILTKTVLDIIKEIPRLIPYEGVRGSEEQKITTKNGLMEYKDTIPYLETEYETILKDNYAFLSKVRKIRNKFEHAMHKNIVPYSGSGSQIYFEIGFIIGQDSFELKACEFIRLAKQLNKLFASLVDDVKDYANKAEKTEYYYYKKIAKINFADFNDIYDSELLRKIGRVIFEC